MILRDTPPRSTIRKTASVLIQALRTIDGIADSEIFCIKGAKLS